MCTLFRFQTDARGGVAIIFALLFVPMVLALGAGIDFARYEIHRVQLQSAVDRGVLAAAALSQTAPARQTVEDFIAANSANLDTELNVTETSALNSKVVSAEASYLMPTSFLHLIGIPEMTINVSARAQESRPKIEISLVLDISASMNDNGRMAALRPAAREFIDAMLPESARDHVSISIVPFSGQVALTEAAFVALRGNKQYERSFCFDFATNSGYGTGVPNFRNLPQVPPFRHGSSGAGIDPYWCPLQGSTIMAMSNEPDALKAHINGLRLYYGTGSAFGINWGLLLLDPGMRPHMAAMGQGSIPAVFANRPANFNDEETVKVIVMMTDGGITLQLRPRNRSGCNINTSYGSTSICYQQFESRNQALNNMNRVCDAARTNDVSVYTIAFQVSAEDRAEMRNCATSPSQFFEINDLDISAAFRAIANSINDLKLTQ